MNTVNGGAGNDLLINQYPDIGGTWDGGADIDTIDFSADNFVGGGSMDLSAASFTLFGTTFLNFENAIGSQGGNVITGTAGINLLDGQGGDDTINGGDGNDTIRGGAGADTLDGGNDTDTLSYAGSSGGVTVDLDTNTASGGDAAGDTISNFENVLGSALGDTLTGSIGINVIDGGDGDDTINGGASVDTINGGNGNDTFLLTGSSLGDNIDGGADIDTLDLSGFTFNTGHIVDLAAGTWREEPTLGTWTIVNVENVTGSDFDNTITGSGGANVLNGRGGNDTIFGGNGADTLNGGDGNDTLRGEGGLDSFIGGAGNDTFVVDAAGETVTEAAGGGTDTVLTSVTYALALGEEIENLRTTNAAGLGAIDLTGNGLANDIRGNNGINLINGGGGADTMVGFGGNDTYVVNDAGDTVFEAAGGGTDTILTSVNYTLLAGQEVENLRSTNAAGVTAINLAGNGLANDIRGNNGINVINGGGGVDTLVGFGGNDTYVVDSAADSVIEAVGGGTDLVQASVSYALAAGQEIENLWTTNVAGVGAINLTGNGLANNIRGNNGNNTLNGGTGADTMLGFGGNDTYFVDNAGDGVFEVAGNGTDTVLASVSYTLTAGQEVENLRTTNAAGLGAINLTGNSFAQSIAGNAGNNVLNGKLGNDTLNGGNGQDSFVFDTALGAANVDTILTFITADDTIVLENAIFAALGVGALAAGAFNTGAAATQADDRIIYDGVSKALLYDADGVGGAAAIQFASITNLGGVLSAADFSVI